MGDLIQLIYKNSENNMGDSKRGRDLVNDLPIQDGLDIISYITVNTLFAALEEIKAKEGPFFEKVDEIYKELKQPCYFCNEDIDPNEVEFTKDTRLCLFCLLKVGNILTAFGFDPKKLPGIVSTRKVQKTRI